jgi:hypothetical protein
MGKPLVQGVKKCRICNKEKTLGSFYIHNKKTGLLRGECSDCTKARRIKYTHEFPFKRKLDVINQRCYNPNNKSYKYYGGKGIKCCLSIEDLKYLWDRDKGFLLTYPSMDRKDSNGDYTVENCQWIEQYDNVVNGKRKLKEYYKLKSA